MAYVSVPKDMTEIKPRLILNLTKRQIICFGAAAATGIPLFLAFKGIIGNTGAMLLMTAAVIPAFFFAIYSKDGVIPAEKYMLLVLRQMLFYPKIRVYRTQNMYAYMENKKQEVYFVKTGKPAGAGQTNTENGRTKSRPKDKFRRT
jgi:hypothetical protein